MPDPYYDQFAGTTGGTAIWPQWVSNYSTGAYNYYPTPAQTIWYDWVSTGTSPQVTINNVTVGGTTGSQTIWIDWMNNLTTSAQQATEAIRAQQEQTARVWREWERANPGLAEQSRQRLADQQERMRKQWAETEKQHKRSALVQRNRSHARALRDKFARRRAEALLLEHLDEKQREEWTTGKYFHVETAGGTRVYRIQYGLAGNVQLVKCDQPVNGRYGTPLRAGNRFCAHVYHPDGPVPNEDNVLAQKLLIEASEADFLAMANVS